MPTKTKPKQKAKFVNVVIAYKISGNLHGNSLFVEVFSNKNAAEIWEDALRDKGFMCQHMRKLLNK